MNSFIDAIKSKLNADNRFRFIDRGEYGGVWTTRNPNNEPPVFIDLKKPLAGKGYGGFDIYVYGETDHGVELKIQMYVPSYCEWDSVFEGFVENEYDFDRIMVMLGLN